MSVARAGGGIRCVALPSVAVRRDSEAVPRTRQEGIEPPTYGLEGRCSIRLSYWREWATASGLKHRGERIRTSDPLHPRQVRYQAALHPANPTPQAGTANTKASQRAILLSTNDPLKPKEGGFRAREWRNWQTHQT